MVVYPVGRTFVGDEGDAEEDCVRNINALPRANEKAPAAPPAEITAVRRYLPLGSAERKRMPLASGLLDYFPDACAAVAEVSFIGNEKHNPGEPLHHARGKSMDHADCVARHLVERGGYEDVTYNGVTYRTRHSAALAWRALALLQEELELEHNLTTPRGATALPGR